LSILFFQISTKQLPQELLFFWLKYAPNRFSDGALPQSPLRKLTALPRHPSCLGGGDQPREKGKGMEGEERGKGKGTKGRKG